jgi:inner membrane protein
VYRTGHLGVSLLVSAPLAHLLLAAGKPSLALVTVGVVVGLASLPDVDQELPVPHRGPTHSLLFAALVGGVFAGVVTLADVSLPGAFGLSARGYAFLLGVVAVLAHLLGDTLTPMGVDYLWPIDWDVSLGLVTADNAAANYGLFAAGVFAVVAVSVNALGLVG